MSNFEFLEQILQQYGTSFHNKVFESESTQEDDLMLVFGLTQVIKAENKQYWGRELGMCWQRLVSEVCRQTRQDFKPGIRDGLDEICDLVVGLDAIDTKYRIGSGDSGTLKKFRQYGQKLKGSGYRPVLLILRTDNLPQAINTCIVGGWTVLTGADAFQYLLDATHFDLQAWLQVRKGNYKPVIRPEQPESGTL
jgi:hypothetical protein